MNLSLTAIKALVDWGTGSAFTFPNLVRATLERLPAAPSAWDPDGTNPESARPAGVEPDGECALSAPAGSRDQGKTPSDR